MMESPLVENVLFHIGPVPIAASVVVTWGIMAALVAVALLFTLVRRLAAGTGGALVTYTVEELADQIGAVMRISDARPFLPLLGTLFLFILFANLCSLVPGIEAPTGRLETTAALAGIVFFAVHWYGVRRLGLLGYLASFARPVLIMVPLNVISQITRTLSLAVRLFGNVMSGAFIGAIVIALAGLFVPIPFMALEILVGVIQAYIFTVLAAVFIGAAIGTTESDQET